MRALVLLWRPDQALPVDPHRYDMVIAADSGLLYADKHTIPVDLAIGDFDSTPPELLAAFESAGTTLERFDTAKDFTDGELALQAAIARKATAITVLGSRLGRLDQALGIVQQLGAASLQHVAVDGYLDGDYFSVIRSSMEFKAALGTTLSLLPLGGSATGISTAGLQFPLHNEVLEYGSLRGMSNVFEATHATVSVKSGALLALLS